MESWNLLRASDRYLSGLCAKPSILGPGFSWNSITAYSAHASKAIVRCKECAAKGGGNTRACQDSDWKVLRVFLYLSDTPG